MGNIESKAIAWLSRQRNQLNMGTDIGILIFPLVYQGLRIARLLHHLVPSSGETYGAKLY